MRSKTLMGAALATAAGLVFTTASVTTAQAAEAEVKCMGINGCKGQGACRTATNGCSGQNTCKGQGVTMTSHEHCTAKGGKVNS